MYEVRKIGKQWAVCHVETGKDIMFFPEGHKEKAVKRVKALNREVSDNA